MGKKQDLYDIKTNILLANKRTLADPEIIRVLPGERIRLRLIDGGIVNNLYVKLPKKIMGKVVATDGHPTQPYYNNTFDLPISNRLDIRLDVPNHAGIYPIFFQAVGRKLRTGIILATPGEAVPKFSSYAKKATPGYNYVQDFQIHPLHPLFSQKTNRTIIFHLTGNMMKYQWGINGAYWPHTKPVFIREGDHVKMIIINDTGMSHPMHFHGHVFQLVNINGINVNGYEGDTINVLPHSEVTLVFAANNPGIWAFHCHLLYHQATGMFTTVNYFNYPPPDFYLKELGMTLAQYQKLADQMIQQKTEDLFSKHLHHKNMKMPKKAH
jgi:FtsP/CotA-like multicopper oxidase with cupredoxin domain